MKLHTFLLLVIFSATANAGSYLATKLEDASPSTKSGAAVASSPAPARDSSASPPPASKKTNPPLTFNEWQRKAMEAFPELKDPASNFNHVFIQRVNAIKQTKPAFLNDPKWPFLLAQEINNADMALIPGLNLTPIEPVIEIKPYDDLGKANVRLECIGQDMTKITTKTPVKDIELSVSQVEWEKTPVTVEAVFVQGGAGKETFVAAGSKKLNAGIGTVNFSSNAANNSLPSRHTDGQKVIGWLARAISPDGRILGVAASSEKYLFLAQNPKQLADVLTENH